MKLMCIKFCSCKLSPSEIRYLMVNLGEKITDEELYDLVALVDTNGDGHISLKGMVIRNCYCRCQYNKENLS